MNDNNSSNVRTGATAPNATPHGAHTCTQPRRFHLVRVEDTGGISGTGLIAEGIQFTNGMCVLSWLTPTTSTAVYGSIRDVETIHGHGGRTGIRWLDLAWEDLSGPEFAPPGAEERAALTVARTYMHWIVEEANEGIGATHYGQPSAVIDALLDTLGLCALALRRFPAAEVGAAMAAYAIRQRNAGRPGNVTNTVRGLLDALWSSSLTRGLSTQIAVRRDASTWGDGPHPAFRGPCWVKERTRRLDHLALTPVETTEGSPTLDDDANGGGR